MGKIKYDRKNFRKHSEENKEMIRKILAECGAGRSVVVDADDELIAGNGVFEQAEKLGIKTRVIETDGSELVVVKRTDLHADDEKRKRLAFADNATADRVEWDFDALRMNIDAKDLQAFGVKVGEKKLDKDGNYENKETPIFEQPLQLLPKQDYILIVCEQNEFDEAREHFGLGFVLDTHARRKAGEEKVVKARALKWADYKRKLEEKQC